MKLFLSTCFLFFFINGKAQNITDFKYIIVPQFFSDFVKEDYQLNLILKSTLRKKDFEIVAEGASNTPLQLQNDKCLAANADIKTVQSSFQNKLKLIFTDCNANVIGEFEGSSKIKDFKNGYQEALNFALNKISNYKVNSAYKLTENINPKAVISNSNLYKSSDNTLYSINYTSNSTFEVTDEDSKKIIAKFYPTSQKNTYHVSVFLDKENYNTIGFVNDNTIIIEYMNGENSWKTKIFTKE